MLRQQRVSDRRAIPCEARRAAVVPGPRHTEPGVDFDTTLPRTAPQLLVLNLYERCLRPQSIAITKPGGCATNRKVIETMDWNRLKAWLNR